MRGRNVTGRSAEVRAAFSSNYLAYQYRFVEFFVEHLTDLSRTFGGDLQQMVVLAIIGQVQMRAMHEATAAGEDPLGLPPQRVSIAASRIADVTGIPRETVRRKLAALKERGWIEQSGSSAWRLVVDAQRVPARIDLDGVNERALTRISRLFAELETLAP